MAIGLGEGCSPARNVCYNVVLSLYLGVHQGLFGIDSNLGVEGWNPKPKNLNSKPWGV